MKPAIRLAMLFLLVASMLPWSAAQARPESVEDRTLAPYFFVKSDDPALDRLPLKSTSASVRISGVIADVLVTQFYRNEGKKPLEATYVVPASTRAAVYGMKMTIGKRVIEAQVRKRDEARRDYEKARDQGRSASLLEQQRPNVFQMNVANIMPVDEIKVEMRYTELIVPTDRVYEFVYPSVVGPRYSLTRGDLSSVLPDQGWTHRRGAALSHRTGLLDSCRAGGHRRGRGSRADRGGRPVRSAGNAGPGRPCEIAFVVGDEYQHRGIGTLLMAHLAAIARQLGYTAFEAEVLSRNRSMLAVFERSGMPMRKRLQSGVVHVRLSLRGDSA